MHAELVLALELALRERQAARWLRRYGDNGWYLPNHYLGQLAVTDVEASVGSGRTRTTTPSPSP